MVTYEDGEGEEDEDIKDKEKDEVRRASASFYVCSQYGRLLESPQEEVARIEHFGQFDDLITSWLLPSYSNAQRNHGFRPQSHKSLTS